MLAKCGEGTRYIYWKKFESALVSNGFSVAYARRNKRELCESRPGGKTTFFLACHRRKTCVLVGRKSLQDFPTFGISMN